MKKAVSVLGYVLFTLIVLLPLGVLLFLCFGYTFELADYNAFAVITALVAAGATVVSIIAKEEACDKHCAVLFALSAPLSLANAAFYLNKCSSTLAAVCMMVCISCCFILTMIKGGPWDLRVGGLIIFAVMLIPVCIICFITMLFADFGSDTVVRTVESPDNAYYAEVIDNDQGALGGATYVYVHKRSGINAFIFKISKIPQRIYAGDWGEFMNISVYWKDEHCLVINNTEYVIE